MNMARCPICDEERMTPFLTRNHVPVHQNLLIGTQAAAVETPTGELALWICEGCGFVSNRAFEMAKLQYGDDYENIQGYSPAFQVHTESLIHTLIHQHQVRGCRVVEVGCGKGAFLKELFQACEGEMEGYGFDPSYTGPLSEGDGRLHFYKDYYNDEYADIPADVIICRHVIEHVPEPVSLLRTIRASLANSPHPRLFFETPCLAWILKNQVIWDFFYEHCAYFTADSLSLAFERAGFQVKQVSHVFDGQYLWLEATLPGSAESSAPITRPVGDLLELASAYAEAEVGMVVDWRLRIETMCQEGKVAIWGAGAKGVTFANLVDPQRQWIDCVVDLNPKKQNHYVPGTGHLIVGIEALGERKVRNAILMNPNYREENLGLLRQARLDIKLVE